MSSAIHFFALSCKPRNPVLTTHPPFSTHSTSNTFRFLSVSRTLSHNMFSKGYIFFTLPISLFCSISPPFIYDLLFIDFIIIIICWECLNNEFYEARPKKLTSFCKKIYKSWRFCSWKICKVDIFLCEEMLFFLKWKNPFHHIQNQNQE